MMKNELNKELSKKIGNYLKKVRKEKRKSAKKVGDKLGYSQGHISGIENGTKVIQNKSFIEEYLKVITDSNITEMNRYINDINNLSAGTIELPTYLKEASNLMDAFLNEYEIDESKINTFNNEDYEGDIKKTYFPSPINDLSFHLTDINNLKYFEKIILSDEDREYIKRHIINYLQIKYTNLNKQIDKLYDSNKIDKKTLNQEKFQINRILDKLNGDHNGEL